MWMIWILIFIYLLLKLLFTVLKPIITAYVDIILDITIPGCTQISSESIFVTNISLQPWIGVEMNSRILAKIKYSRLKCDLQYSE